MAVPVADAASLGITDVISGHFVDLIPVKLHIGLGNFRNIALLDASKVSNNVILEILLNQVHRFIMFLFNHILVECLFNLLLGFIQ